MLSAFTSPIQTDSGAISMPDVGGLPSITEFGRGVRDGDGDGREPRTTLVTTPPTLRSQPPLTEQTTAGAGAGVGDRFAPIHPHVSAPSLPLSSNSHTLINTYTPSHLTRIQTFAEEYGIPTDIAVRYCTRHLCLPRDAHSWMLVRRFIYKGTVLIQDNQDNEWMRSFYGMLYYKMLLIEEDHNLEGCILRILYEYGPEMYEFLRGCYDHLSADETVFASTVVAYLFRDLNPEFIDFGEYDGGYIAQYQQCINQLAVAISGALTDFTRGRFYILRETDAVVPSALAYEYRQYYPNLYRLMRRVRRYNHEGAGYRSIVECIRMVFRMNDICELEGYGGDGGDGGEGRSG